MVKVSMLKLIPQSQTMKEKNGLILDTKLERLLQK